MGLQTLAVYPEQPWQKSGLGEGWGERRGKPLGREPLRASPVPGGGASGPAGAGLAPSARGLFSLHVAFSSARPGRRLWA